MANLEVRYVHSLYEIRLYKPNGEYWPISLSKWIKEDRAELEKFLELSAVTESAEAKLGTCTSQLNSGVPPHVECYECVDWKPIASAAPEGEENGD